VPFVKDDVCYFLKKSFRVESSMVYMRGSEMSYRKDELVFLDEIENGEFKQVANVAEELKTAKLAANAGMKWVYRIYRD